MRVSLRPAARRASVIGAAVTLLFGPRGSGAPRAASSQPLSCAAALEKGKDLLGQHQFQQAEELLTRAAGVCPRVAEVFDTLGLAYDFDGHTAEAQTAHRKA